MTDRTIPVESDLSVDPKSERQKRTVLSDSPRILVVPSVFPARLSFSLVDHCLHNKERMYNDNTNQNGSRSLLNRIVGR